MKCMACNGTGEADSFRWSVVDPDCYGCPIDIQHAYGTGSVEARTCLCVALMKAGECRNTLAQQAWGPESLPKAVDE